VYDPNHEDSQIIWNLSGDSNLLVEIVNDNFLIEPRDSTWTGSETIQFEACDPGGLCSIGEASFWVLDQPSEDVEIFYVGNEGFLIVAGDKKILIDAIFLGNPNGYRIPDQVLNSAVNAWPPFDGLDLILVTHNHADHFSIEPVIEAMENNPDAVLISTSQITRSVSSRNETLTDRVFSITLRPKTSEVVVIDGIGLEIIDLPHGDGGPINLSYIVTIAGNRLLHLGDFSPSDRYEMLDYIQVYDLVNKGIDVAFVPDYLLFMVSYHPVVIQGIKPEYIIPMHWAYLGTGSFDQIADHFPNTIFFHEELESWVLPGK
jgi:L-ascorbate metabolism protein UlaG (beta-lactamase superfamily)